MRWRLAAATILALVALGAQPAGATSTASGLADHIHKIGWGCTDYEASTNSVSIGNLPTGDIGHCTIDGQRSTLSVYRTAADLKKVLAAVPTIGCSFGKGFGITEFRYVYGKNWTIDTPSSATTPKLAKAMKADRIVYRCKP